MTIQDTGETSVLTITAESRLIDMNRARERRFTDADQQQLYPGDLGLQYVAGLQDKEFPWGRVDNTGAVADAGYTPSSSMEGFNL
jgi:hypothetical protein